MVDKNVIEIGAGTGLVSIVASLLGKEVFFLLNYVVGQETNDQISLVIFAFQCIMTWAYM